MRRKHSSSALAQRIYRGYLYGRRIAREENEKRFREAQEVNKTLVHQRIASIILQKCFKHAHAIKKLRLEQEMKRAEIEQLRIIYRNASLIQKIARICRSRRLVNFLREEKARMSLRARNATKIQVTLRHLQNQFRENDRRLQSSALNIQSHWRHHRSNLMFSQLLLQAAEKIRQKRSAVQTLQRLARVRAARSLVWSVF